MKELKKTLFLIKTEIFKLIRLCSKERDDFFLLGSIQQYQNKCNEIKGLVEAINKIDLFLRG